jgi:hypothetical protein
MKEFVPLFVIYRRRPETLVVGVGTVNVKLGLVAVARMAELESIKLCVMLAVLALE